jgi:hypothetical protein
MTTIPRKTFFEFFFRRTIVSRLRARSRSRLLPVLCRRVARARAISEKANALPRIDDRTHAKSLRAQDVQQRRARKHADVMTIERGVPLRSFSVSV